MAGYISLDAQKFWAVPNAKPLKSNLQAILDTSPHLEYCRNIPGHLSTTQDISSMLLSQGGSLTNRLLDDMDIISSEGGDKDSHDYNTHVGDENIAGMRPFRSDIGSLSPDDYSSRSNAKAAMRSDYKKRTGNTANLVEVGNSEIAEDLHRLDLSSANQIIQPVDVCTELATSIPDTSTASASLHQSLTFASPITNPNIDESESLCTDLSSQSMASDSAKSTPELLSDCSQVSQDGLNKVGEQLEKGRTGLDPLPSSPQDGQILSNDVSSKICTTCEDPLELRQSQTKTEDRYKLRHRSSKNTGKRPIIGDEAYNNENEDLPPPKRAKRVQQAHKQPRKQKSLATCGSNIGITTTGTGGSADATFNNERMWPLSGGVFHSNKEDGVERLALYFTRTTMNQRDSTSPKAKDHESVTLRDKNLTIAEVLRGEVNLDHDLSRSSSLLLSNADIRLTRINGISMVTLSFPVEPEGKHCQEHTDQNLTAVITPPEHHQAHTNQDLIPVEALLAKVYDPKIKQFCFLTRWAGSHDRYNEWRKETDLLPDDVERYNIDHKKNFFGKVIAKRERQGLGGVYEYKMKWRYQPRHGGYSWLLEEEIEEGLVTKYKNEKAQGRPQRKKNTKKRS